jgi:demethoxyubiquinone hydroxylase (CLK1/Coq7/Cat5 family)
MTSEKSLIALLQMAYSGERAAALAYRGHWKSVKDSAISERIQSIEAEEWHHRKLVGEMLEKLGAKPSRFREFKAAAIGYCLGFACHFSGWFAPMYGAGKLESRNIGEYETAAKYARECGREELIDALLTMAEIEWEHEHFFRAQVENHFLVRVIPVWKLPASKEMIRAKSLRFEYRL